MDIIDENSTTFISSVTLGDNRTGVEGASSYTPSLKGSPPSSKNWGSESENQTPLLSGYQTPVLRQIAEEEDNEKRISAAFASVSAEYWAGRADELMLPTMNEVHKSCTDESVKESTPFAPEEVDSTDVTMTTISPEKIALTLDSTLPTIAVPPPPSLTTPLPPNAAAVDNLQVKRPFLLRF